jgi:hypothetical protein
MFYNICQSRLRDIFVMTNVFVTFCLLIGLTMHGFNINTHVFGKNIQFQYDPQSLFVIKTTSTLKDGFSDKTILIGQKFP